MAKSKKIEAVDAEPVIEDAKGLEPIMYPPVICQPINPIEIDFGRDDLNQLRDKVNEIIKSRCL